MENEKSNARGLLVIQLAFHMANFNMIDPVVIEPIAFTCFL